MNSHVTTQDNFGAFDAEFAAAFLKVSSCRADQTPINEEIETAADTMFDIAIQLGDPDMLSMCFAVFAGFIEQRRAPPWTMLEHVHDAFRRYRVADCDTLDAAFGLKQAKKGQPSRWVKRVRDRFQSGLVWSLVEPLGANKARETVEELLDEPDLRRVYAKYRMIVKGK